MFIFYLTGAFDKGKLAWGLLGIGVVSVFIYRKIMQTIINPLIYLDEVLTEVAQGDIVTKEIETRTNRLGRWLVQRILGEIKGVFARAEAVSKHVEVTIEQILYASKKVVKDIQKQKAFTEEMSLSIHQMDNSVKKISENAQLMSRLSKESSSAILQMTLSIKEVFQNTERASSSVEETSSAIEQLAASIKQVALQVEGLALLAQQTLDAIAQINLSIQEIEKNAKHSADLSRKTEEDVTNGKNSVFQTIDWMDKIKTAVSESLEIMRRLKSNSEKAGKILDSIDEITDQISLLALNASIIAAQAGEHGRGFAVVADQTKELAQRSATSTKEISTLIQLIQSDSLSTATSMEASFKKVLEGVQSATLAGNVLEKIAQSAKDSREAAVNIAHETETQAEKSQKIQENTEKVTRMLQDLVNATKEETKSSNQIVQSTKNMRDLTDIVQQKIKNQLEVSGQISLAEGKVTQQIDQVLKLIQHHSQDSEKTTKLIEETTQITQDNTENIRNVEELSTVINGILLSQINILKQEIGRYLV
jgi:methyl-accepting chemotaxis protein